MLRGRFPGGSSPRSRRARLQDSANLWMTRNVTLQLMAEVGAPAPWRREGKGAAVKGTNALALHF